MSAADFIPAKPSLKAMRLAARTCKGCDLWRRATQTVFGEGPARARVVIVGEQPGDAEDREGRPFVGPAGLLLDRALEEAGIARSEVYLTNVVKHFKWEPRGKRRIHSKPRMSEVKACRPWLEAELGLLRPHAVVCLGATAAQALLGRAFKVSTSRGMVESAIAPLVLATIHPSSILRARSDDERHTAMRAFVRDLAVLARRLSS